MPFVLLIAGATLLIVAVRNTQDDLFSLLKGDFTGPNNFVYWVFSLLVIGALGYIPKLKPISIAFLSLVILVLFLTKGNPQGVGGGFFNQLTAGLNTTQVPSTSVTAKTGDTGVQGPPSTNGTHVGSLALPDLNTTDLFQSIQ
jgi:hypothetical protein